MRSTTDHVPQQETVEPPEDLQLVSWPPRDDGVAGWIFLSLALLLPIVIGFATGNVLFLLVGLLLVTLAMWRMWIPITYQLGPRGVVETVLGRSRRIPWTAVKQWEVRRNGLLLLLSDDPAPLVRLWGVLIRFGGASDKLIRLVTYYAGEPRSQKQGISS